MSFRKLFIHPPNIDFSWLPIEKDIRRPLYTGSSMQPEVFFIDIVNFWINVHLIAFKNCLNSSKFGAISFQEYIS